MLNRPAWLRPLGHQAAAILAAVLAVVPGFAPAPPSADEQRVPSLVMRAPEIPLAAVTPAGGVRVEKQVQSQRLSLLKPDRSGRHLATASRATSLQPQPLLHRTYRDLPQRPLPTRRSTPRAPDDPSH